MAEPISLTLLALGISAVGSATGVGSMVTAIKSRRDEKKRQKLASEQVASVYGGGLPQSPVSQMLIPQIQTPPAAQHPGAFQINVQQQFTVSPSGHLPPGSTISFSSSYSSTIDVPASPQQSSRNSFDHSYQSLAAEPHVRPALPPRPASAHGDPRVSAGRLQIS